MKRQNPINAQTQPIAGRQLPSDFWTRPLTRNSMGSMTMDQRNFETLAPQWTSKTVTSIIKDARLERPTTDRADSSSGPQLRMDGELKLISRDDQWEIWQDQFGNKVHKRRSK